jgi:oligopeptide/dipeptide ABC transporter ATP-binding protein
LTDDLLLEVKNLQTYFYTETGIVKAVDGVSFNIKRGEIVGMLGESGCGKSVTGYSILHLINAPGKIVGGEMLFHRGENDVLDLLKFDPRGEEIRQIRGHDIAMVFQEPMTALDPLFTVGDQVMEALLVHQKVSKKAAWSAAIELLDRVRMPEPQRAVEKYPHQLSGGMRQRVVIALALACSPKLLIADEPTTALDVTTEAQILELMRDLQREMGMAILFITHDLGIIAEMADSAVVMYLGSVVEHSDIKSLFNAPQHPYTQALYHSIPKLGEEKLDRLQTISGMVPPPYNLPKGCKFHPRCSHFMPGVCDAAEPPLYATEPGHDVRCYLYDGVHHGA